jgi:calcineurin-like phosphoesterase family protein
MMKARDDIVPYRTWVISDTHFGHKNIIGYCHRPENFEEILLEEIAAVVQPGDTLLHLGDLCYKGNSWFKNVIAPKIAPEARKLIVLGNHDKQRYSFYKQTGWKVCRPFYIVVSGVNGVPIPPGDMMEATGDRIVSFSHYQWSVDSTDGKLPGETTEMSPNHHRMHGHIHNNGYYDGRSNPGVPDFSLVPFLAQHSNLSCEMTKYKPVRLDLLINAAVFGRLPGRAFERARANQRDGDSPSASDIGKESHHA